MSPVTVALLGPPRLLRDGELVEVSTRKAVALLAYLVLTQRRHGRETLAALFWPDYDQTHARGTLRNTLYALNKALGGAGLEISREDIGFVPDDRLSVDVIEFRQRLDECEGHGHPREAVCRSCLEPLKRAADLYRDDLLAGFNVGASPEFEQWQLFQTETLRGELADALERLSRGYRDAGAFESALVYTRRWESLNPLDEAANRRVMEVCAMAGQRSAALQQYQELMERLRTELSIVPQTETAELYRSIRDGQIQSGPASPPAGNLAAYMPSTPFVGRENELAKLEEWLTDGQTRLLSIVGPGGMGKSRLALQCALTQGSRFGHGAYFVPLAPVRGDLLVSAVAQELGLAFFGSRDLKTQLLNYLREKHLLLVLDNFEHLRDQAALLTEISNTAPRVKLLVTSREWLNLPHERVYDLLGLPYPEANTRRQASLEEYGAVQLFVQNARRVHWGFALEPEERGVERICQLVEGMPLGIELAAAWVRVISCQEIASEIERDLQFLSTTLGGLPERHRSLRLVFDYSYNRLDRRAQLAFSKMSVFRGGMTRSAAQRVAGAPLPVLATLVDHSLLHRTASGRYEVHELLRQYGQDQLRADPAQEAQTQSAHCAYYLEFLHQHERGLKGARRNALDEIAQEVDNVRAAWRHAVAVRRFEDMAKSFESLFLFLRVKSQFKEGAEAFAAAAVALPEVGRNIMLAEILTRQATFLELLGQFDEARALVRKSLELLPPDVSDARPARAFALTEFGAVAVRLGELVEARQNLQEGLALYEEEGDGRGSAHALRWLGQIATDLDGDYNTTQKIYLESLELYRKIGDRRGVAAMQNNMGMSAGDLGEYAEAKRFFRDSISAYRELGDRYGVALALNNLAVVSRMQGEYQEAWDIFSESLTIRREVGDRFAIALVLANLGKTATYMGNYEQARHLLDESLAMHREVGDRIGIATTIAKRGVLAGQTGELQKAKKYLLEAIQMAMESRAASVCMQILAEIAALLAHSDSHAQNGAERAASLAEFILHNPASDHITRQAASALMAELETRLSAQAMAAARDWARGQDAATVTRELLADE